MIRLVMLVAAVVAVATPGRARAQDFPPITDRDYALDLYNGNALGSLRMVGMGGAAAALVQGSAGMSVNPASVGVRPPTSVSKWDWDVHADWLNPGLGVDRDNNGIDDVADESVTLSPLIYGGAALLYKEIAIGVAITYSNITSEVGGVDLTQAFAQLQLHLAGRFWRDQLVLGVGVRAGTLTIDNPMDNAEDPSLFSMSTGSGEAGALWMPANLNLRVGAAVTLPAGESEADPDPACDPNDCLGLILPDRIAVPWSVTVGGAVRLLSKERWNRKVVGKKWLDEEYLLLAADAVITGAVEDGHGVEAFSRNQLQVSGDRTAVSVRAGAEYEWIPGWLRVRAGSYYEPSRFRDPDGDRVPGRVHATAGVDVRVWQFKVWRWKYRLRASLLADLAKRYANGGLSVGFWR